MSGYSTQSIPPYTYGDEPVVQLEIIADVDSGDGYSWDQFVVLRDPGTGLLYIATGSGCSCDYLYDDIRSLADLGGPLTLHEAAAKAQAWERGEPDETYMAESRAGLGARVVEALLAMERSTP